MTMSPLFCSYGNQTNCTLTKQFQYWPIGRHCMVGKALALQLSRACTVIVHAATLERLTGNAGFHQCSPASLGGSTGPPGILSHPKYVCGSSQHVVTPSEWDADRPTHIWLLLLVLGLLMFGAVTVCWMHPQLPSNPMFCLHSTIDSIAGWTEQTESCKHLKYMLHSS